MQRIVLVDVPKEAANEILWRQAGERFAALATVEVDADGLELLLGVAFHVHQNWVQGFADSWGRRGWGSCCSWWGCCCSGRG